jgi:hypothetical protein
LVTSCNQHSHNPPLWLQSAEFWELRWRDTCKVQWAQYTSLEKQFSQHFFTESSCSHRDFENLIPGSAHCVKSRQTLCGLYCSRELPKSTALSIMSVYTGSGEAETWICFLHIAVPAKMLTDFGSAAGLKWLAGWKWHLRAIIYMKTCNGTRDQWSVCNPKHVVANAGKLYRMACNDQHRMHGVLLVATNHETTYESMKA